MKVTNDWLLRRQTANEGYNNKQLTFTGQDKDDYARLHLVGGTR